MYFKIVWALRSAKSRINVKTTTILTVANRLRAVILQHLIDKINFAMLAIIEVDYHGLLLFSSFGADVRIFMGSRNYQNTLSPGNMIQIITELYFFQINTNVPGSLLTDSS